VVVVVVVVVVVEGLVVAVVGRDGVGPPLVDPAGVASAIVATVTAVTSAALIHPRILTTPPS
jgi:hypothetical protein